MNAKVAIRRGRLTQSQLKWVAVVTMTIDHIGSRCGNIPGVGAAYLILRIVGRIAFPIFLYCMVESIRYTHSRPRLVGRLFFFYACHLVCTILGDLICAGITGQSVTLSGLSSIFPDMIYATVIISMVDLFLKGIRDRKPLHLLLPPATAAGIVVWYLLAKLLKSALLGVLGEGNVYTLCRNLLSLVPTPGNLMYGIYFLLLALVWYYLPNHWSRMVAFLVYCLLYFILWPTWIQWFMVLALPFLCFYGGERGGGHKYFFYIYYPVHITVLRILNAFFC